MFGNVCNFKGKKGLHLAHINIRSLWNKIDVVKQTVLTSGLSLISFSESWLNENIDDELIKIPGYICFRNDRSWIENNSIKKGGGICCYILENLCASYSEFETLNVSSRDIEILWISLTIPNCKKIIVGNIYRPPQGNVKKFCDTIDDKLEIIKNSQRNNYEIFILGDFNINYKINNNQDTKQLKWLEQKANLKQIIKDITRFSNNNSCIDLILTDSLFLSDFGTLNVNLSDHEMIYVTRKHVTKPKHPSSFRGRSYVGYNEELFMQNLMNNDWERFYNVRDPNVAWSMMKNIILSHINVMCPVQTFYVKSLKDPWITNEILEAIKDEDRLLCNAKRSNSEADWIGARRRRNEVKTLVKHAKSNFIKDNLENFKDDSKKFWKSLQDILPAKKGNKGNKILLKNPDGNLVTNDKDAANKLNNFFAEIGPNLAKDLNDPWIYSGIECDNRIDDITTNRVEVLKLLKLVDVGKSSAIPDLASKILKPALIALIDQITFILNLSFETNIFPSEWKLATIVPLPKDGDLSQCTNYRPISLLPMQGKILEQIIHNRFDSFCENNNILNKNQGGFRKKHSTISTVAYFTNNLYNAINSKNYSIATYIDFSKAFDTVDHQILIRKLAKMGIKGNSQKLIKNYLENRQQRTIVNDTESEMANISCGVPQGSVLGLLLFLLYINDLCNTIENCSTFLYADDTVLVSNEPDIYTAHMHLQSDLDNVANWCKGNKLSINIKKTKAMVIGTRSMVKKHNHISRLKICGKPIEYVFQYKYLGITIDEILSFHTHLNNTTKIVAHKNFLLHKIRSYITEDASIRVYKTMILPYLDYGDIFFANANSKQLKKLQTLQNRALRICLNTRIDTPIEILHQSVQLQKLIPRRESHILNFMFKNKNNKDFLNQRNIRTRLHDAPVFSTSKPILEKYKANVFYYGAVLWNNLRPSIRNIETYDKFKATQKQWALNQP